MKKIYFVLLITFTIWGARLPSINISGIGRLSPIRILVIISFIFILLLLAKRKKIQYNEIQKYTSIYLFMTLMWTILTFCWTPDRKVYMTSIITYLTSFGILVITMAFVQDREMINFCEKIFLLNVLVVLVIAIYESITGNYIILNYESYLKQRNVLGLYKPVATFYNINNLATFLVLATPISCNAISQFKKGNKICKSIYLILDIFVIILTNSRGALLAIIIFMIMDFKNNFSMKKTIIFGIILTVSLFFSSTFIDKSPLGELLTMDIFEESRIEIWKETTKTIVNHHFIGIGPGNTTYANLNSSYYKYTFGDPHNYLLEYLGDFGILSLIIFIYWIYKLMSGSKHMSLSGNTYWSYKGKNYYSYYIVFIVLTICPSTMSTFSYLWLIFGLTVSNIGAYDREERERECLEQANH